MILSDHDLISAAPCQGCGRLTEYRYCDDCWLDVCEDMRESSCADCGLEQCVCHEHDAEQTPALAAADLAQREPPVSEPPMLAHELDTREGYLPW